MQYQIVPRSNRHYTGSFVPSGSVTPVLIPGGGGASFPALPFTLPTGLSHNQATDDITGTNITTPFSLPGSTDTSLTDTGNPVTNMTNLQSKVNSVSRGTRIILPVGFVAAGTLTLPEKSGAGWYTIEVAGYATPSAPPTSNSGMATIKMNLRTSPAIKTKDSGVTTTTAGRVGFRGLEITLDSSISTTWANFVTQLIILGDGVAQNSLSKVPDGFYFEGCYIHGLVNHHVRRGIEAHCSNLHVYRTRIEDIHSVSTTGNSRGDPHNTGSDSHPIWGWNGPGPWFIDQCTLSGGDETIGSGGAVPLFNVQVNDVFIRHTRCVKPESYRSVDFWRVKNHFETKAGQRWLLHGCIFEKGWEIDNNQQHAFVVKADSWSGADTKDIQIHNCLVQDLPALILFYKASSSVGLDRIALVNILAKRMHISPYTGANTRVFAGEVAGPVTNKYFDHVTLVTTSTPGDSALGLLVSGAEKGSLTLKNCLIDACGTIPTGVGGIWNSSGQGTAVLNDSQTSWTVDKVRFIRPSTTGPWAQYPAGVQGYTSYNNVGFTNHAAEDYSLTAGAEGKDNATDGWDIGIADWTTFNNKLSLVPAS